jgi:hypothetical protein
VVDVDGDKGQGIMTRLQDYAPTVIAWPSLTFPATIEALGRKGWKHETGKKMPFSVNKDFIMTATAVHLNGKHLSGSPARPYHSLDRNITQASDYVRLFNEILDIESDISLSHLFDIGSLCHQDGKKVRVFVTLGPVPTNILQRLADRVIYVGGSGSEVDATDRDPLEVADEAADKAQQFLGN